MPEPHCQNFSQLLHAVIHCLEPTQLVGLVVRAAEAMRRVSVGCEKKQFQHPTQETLEEKVNSDLIVSVSYIDSGDLFLQGKVVIASASSLSIVL